MSQTALKPKESIFLTSLNIFSGGVDQLITCLFTDSLDQYCYYFPLKTNLCFQMICAGMDSRESQVNTIVGQILHSDDALSYHLGVVFDLKA